MPLFGLAVLLAILVAQLLVVMCTALMFAGGLFIASIVPLKQ